MTLPKFSLLRPETLEEALGARSEDAVPFCGGTELLLAMRMGLLRPRCLIDLKRLPELQSVEQDGDLVRIGAAVTHDRVARSSVTASTIPMLADVAERVGNPRVRVQGTIGGNIAFAEPKSDITAALAALDATVEVRSANASRVVSLMDLVRGAYWTDVGDDELLTEVRIPVVPGRQAVYEKYQTMERPTVGVAVRRDADGSARVVVAAVTGEPVVVDAASVEELDVDGIAADLDVVPDLTGGDRYKRHLVGVTIRRALVRLEEQDHG